MKNKTASDTVTPSAIAGDHGWVPAVWLCAEPAASFLHANRSRSHRLRASSCRAHEDTSPHQGAEPRHRFMGWSDDRV